MMILGLGAPCSLFGKDWMDKWLEVNGMSKDDMENVECNKKFRFGPGRTYMSTVQYKISDKKFSGNLVLLKMTGQHKV